MGPNNVERTLGHAATPAIRLAYNPGPINAYGALTDGQAERNGTPEAPTVRLAVTTAMESCAADSATDPSRYPMHRARRDGGELLAPALLVSYVYLAPFRRHRARYAFRDWVLDSGAFSAKQLGTVIDLNAYIATCQELLATDPQLTEVFALDVIGDWRGTVRNTERMWAAGVPAIPAFHVGAPWELLLDLARQYPKIALGGAVGYRAKLPWAQQAFARIKRDLGHLVPIHGFGFGGAEAVMALPWHSVDATNWEIGPCKYGRWARFGQMSVRGSQQNLRSEVEWYLDLERRARARWRAEMAALEAHGRTVRLAVQQGAESQVQRSGLTAGPAGRLGLDNNRSSNLPRYEAALAPTVRLALAGENTPNRTRYADAFGADPEAPCT